MHYYLNITSRKIKSIKVDEDAISKRKEEVKIEGIEHTTLEAAKEALNKVKEEWEITKRNGVELREKDLLDYFLIELNKEEEDFLKKEKNILNEIKNLSIEITHLDI